MRSTSLLLIFFLILVGSASGQIRVHPTGVNVNVQGPTVIFLTYGGLRDYVPEEAEWCGELVPAAPAIGQRCDPATIFGRLPLRHNLSTFSGTDGFTDVMTIPSSVARRAYQDARAGADSRFFYVRRFVLPFGGGPDVYVAVTCRLAGSGARTPFALLDVQLAFDKAAAVLPVEQGEQLPPLSAEISYNGTGQLRGRWEVVRPGEEPPTQRDLLTEATLPVEERGLQRRYSELDRFSVFLAPSAGARFVLPGPDPERLPTDVEGLYQILLRIEVTDDKEGDSDLAAVGAGAGTVHSGAVAGFPIPPLRYFVGGAQGLPNSPIAGKLYQLLPEEDSMLGTTDALDFSWTDIPHVVLYRLEVDDSGNDRVLAALLPAGLTSYRAPSWLPERASAGPLRWRVAALGLGGEVLVSTPWRTLRAEEGTIR